MIALPFIYFTTLLIIILIKRRTFEVSAAIVTLYVITSLSTILLDQFNLYDLNVPYTKITLAPTIFYCFFTSLAIYPFYIFQSHKIKKIEILNDKKIFNFIVYTYFIVFLLLLVFYYKDLIFRYTFGDILQLREMVNNEELITAQNSFSGIKKLISIIVGIVGESSYLMILFFLYSITFFDRSKVFNALILTGSLSVIIIGVLGIDRSKTFYYIVIFYFLIVFFKPHFQKKQKKILKKNLIIFGSLLIFYFLTITIARFGERDSGSIGGVINYAGQPFIHFCRFFENINPTNITLHRIFPLFYKLFGSEELSSAEWAYYIYSRTQININVFPSFLGTILAGAGILGTIIFVLFFVQISILFLKRKNNDYLTFSKLIMFYILAMVPLIGIIAYYYSTFTRTLMIIVLIFLTLIINKKLKFR